MIDPTEIKGLKDYRERLRVHATKRFTSRSIEKISHITVHHSLTKTGSAEAFAKYHVGTLKWPGIGYHFVVEQDGVIKWCNELEKKSYHVGKSNGFTVGVCMTGDFRTGVPGDAQWQSLFRVLNWLKAELKITSDNVLGHSEFPGYSTKECPCIDMVELRSILRKPKYKRKITQSYSTGKYTLREFLQNENNFFLGEIERLNPQITSLSSPRKTKIEKKTLNSFTYLNYQKSREINDIIRRMENRKYRVFLNDQKNYNLNIVGLRANSTRSNSFDDNLMVFWKYRGNWELRKYSITTDPGLYYLQQPIKAKGTAILKEGQYRSAYKIGKHNTSSSSYTALVQARPVTVIRDYNRDSKLDFDGNKEETGLFGINIHRSRISSESLNVNKWSAGCQVFANSNDFKEFIGICQCAVFEWGNGFTYSLLREF